MYDTRFWWWFPLSEKSEKVVLDIDEYGYFFYEVDKEGNHVDSDEEQEWFVYNVDYLELYNWRSLWGRW